jgi:hypothetical protein
MMAETSDRVAAIAGKYADYSLADLDKDTAHPTQLVRDIRSMAASLLRQDETKGLRWLVKKVRGK